MSLILIDILPTLKREAFSLIFDCPGCGTEKAHMSSTASQIGVHCGCGISFSVDGDEQTVDDWWERES